MGEGLKKTRPGGHCGELSGDGLEEGAPAGFVFENSGDAEDQPVVVREFRAVALMPGPGEEREQGSEKCGGERNFVKFCNNHKKEFS